VSLPARIALSALRRPARHRYGADHPSQTADLHVAPGDGPFPVAVVIHGGSWQPRFSKIVCRPICLDLVRRGWAAWNVEYRRVGAGQGGGWPATFEDVAAAIDHLAALGDPRLDLGAVHVVGHSAGGQLALWAAARRSLPAGAPGAGPQVVARSVVALAPVTDMVRAGTTARALLGGSVDAVPDRYALADPVRRVPPPVPVLVVHPADDVTVPAVRSREYVALARAAGGDVELVEPASGGHRAPIDPASDAWRAAAQRLDARR
jgi:acetyl esterase/lipase